jgi:hypothetical protein
MPHGKIHNVFSTFTNVAYVIAGYMALDFNPILGLLTIGLGIVSAGFHWTRKDAWHTADIVGIYYVFSVLGFWWLLGNTGVLLGLIIGGIGHYSHSGYARYSHQIIGGLGAFSLIAFKFHNSWADVGTVLVFFFLAFIFGKIAVWFDPDEDGMLYDVSHGIWHVWSAIGIYFML